jgi:murein DD-endopeptidase MepM/ murein hydrolase activator NlpD
MIRIISLIILCLLSMPLVADTRLVLNRQSRDNSVSIETNLFGPVQIQLSDQKTGVVLAERVIRGPGTETVSDLPAASLNHLKLISVPGRPTEPKRYAYLRPFSENANAYISQGFNGLASHHDALNAYAIDFALLLGTPVVAARNGIVMEVIDGNPDLGGSKVSDLDNANLIRIVHDDDSMAVYGHLLEASATVKPGQWVAAGTVIAQSGNSGFSHGPHLHFAIQINKGMQLISIPFTMQNNGDQRPIVSEDF